MTLFMVIEESDFPPDRIRIVDGSGWSNPSETIDTSEGGIIPYSREVLVIWYWDKHNYRIMEAKKIVF